MNASRQQYLQSIRADSYPRLPGRDRNYRAPRVPFAGAVALGALVGGLGAMSNSFMTGLIALITGGIFAAIVFLLAKLSKEAALMLVDIADSTVEANSRLLRPCQNSCDKPGVEKASQEAVGGLSC